MEFDQMPVMCPRRRPRSTRVPKELRPYSLFPPAPHITPLLSLAPDGALREARLTLKHLYDLRLATCLFTITPSPLPRKHPVQPYPLPPPQATPSQPCLASSSHPTSFPPSLTTVRDRPSLIRETEGEKRTDRARHFLPALLAPLAPNRPCRQGAWTRLLRRADCNGRDRSGHGQSTNLSRGAKAEKLTSGWFGVAVWQRTVLQNLKEVLELANSSLEKVVKYNVYLADMKDFAEMNKVYIEVSLPVFPPVAPSAQSDSCPSARSQFLPQPMPARSCLQAVAPGAGTVIEIECIAQA